MCKYFAWYIQKITQIKIIILTIIPPNKTERKALLDFEKPQ